MVCRKRKGIKETLIGDELFLTDEKGEELVVLNASALFAWSLCADHTEEEMVEVLAELYPEVEKEVLVTDLRAALQRFSDSGLLEDAVGDDEGT